MGGESVRHTWSESDRYVPRTVVAPMQRLMRNEAAGGVVMLLAAVVALVWANSPWGDSYQALWATPLVVELGDLVHLDHMTLQHWVNDALMAIFFLLIGLEIKREVVHGDLRDVRSVALPILAALGGLAVPALIFVAFNAGGPGADGWGIPMATDIAFAVGIVTLLGSRVPTAAKVFLLTLAVADDIGAIVVIAVFYTSDLSAGWLALAFVGLGVVVVMRRLDVQALVPYLAAGGFVWFAMLESGVHATLAGVALGLLTPAWPLHSPRHFSEVGRGLLDRMDRAHDDDVLTDDELEHNEQLTIELVRAARHATSPLERLEAALSPWVSFVIVPIFALANAGVRLSGDAMSGVFGDPVVMGVAVGLVVGKTVGVFGASFVAVKLGLGQLPTGTTWRHVLGLAMVAGVGFTVALFVASLSFTDPDITDSAKIGILGGSAVAGIVGYLFLRAIPAGDRETELPAGEPVGSTAAVTVGD